MPEEFDWVKPSPLWEAGGEDVWRKEFFQPALLEFTADTFMEDFLAAAGKNTPTALLNTLAQPAAAGQPLRLFQPAHGRYYLVCGSLSCRQPGLPDRQVRRADGETAAFVLRRVQVDAQGKRQEYGWVAAPEENKGWHPLGEHPRRLLKTTDDGGDEERLPLFTAAAGNGRTLWAGYIPVASRETYKVPPSDLSGEAGTDVRLDELEAGFITPLGLLASADNATALRLSVYLMLEFWEYLNRNRYLPEVAAALLATPIPTLPGKAGALVSFLKSQTWSIPGGGTMTLAAAVGKVGQERTALNQPGDSDLGDLGITQAYSLKGRGLNTAGLKTAVKEALPTEKPPVDAPKLSPQPGERYVLRCVYERPQCDPPQVVVSQVSEEFELAPFFDPEAPARPIKIGLPVDVSIAGLRKFKKGVSFMISKALNNKLAAITGKEKDILDGEEPGPEGTLDLGMLCSFSIPIITLCAFILLLIIVVLLNLVFWWLPFFRLCFPLKLSSD